MVAGDELRFDVARFKTVFDASPEQVQLTLAELTRELQQFLVKPDLMRRLKKEVGRVDAAWQAHQEGEVHPSRTFKALQRAEDPEAEYERLRKEAKKRVKERLPCWSPTLYAEGTRRNSENVVHLSCLVLDYDDGTAPEDASLTWDTWFHIVHTTWSHTDETPRFRLVLPLAKPVPAAIWPKVWLWAEELSDMQIDSACKGAARMWSLPSIPAQDHPHLAFAHAGPLLDVFLEPSFKRFVKASARSAVAPHPLMHSERHGFYVAPWQQSEPEAAADSVAEPEAEPEAAADSVAEPEAESEAAADSGAESDAESGAEGDLAALVGELRGLLGQLRGAGVNLVDELERLARLHDEGSLSEDEFKRAKDKLLS